MMAILAVLIFQFLALQACLADNVATYSVPEGRKDPNLKEFSFDLGWGQEFFEAFVEPDISSMTQGNATEIRPPSFNGHAVKFFNMSPEPVILYWVGNDGTPLNMGGVAAFHAKGTASFPGHQFFFAPTDYETSKVVLKHFDVDKNDRTNLYRYDPFTVPGDKRKTDENLSKLTSKDLERYQKMLRSQLFGDEYLKFTGREYLSLYPRKKPMHFMYPADYFGQEFWATTKETKFNKEVPEEELKRISSKPLDRILKEEDPRILSEYRDQDQVLNMTLKVMSIRPRVYEIKDFLSEVEIDHIIAVAKKSNMQLSTTGSGQEDSSKTNTRTSKNTWVGREYDQVIDAIYRRSADLLRIDEALFRTRDLSEKPDFPTRSTIAEQLQLVHYNKRQEYTAHHDFGYARVDCPHQGARFATLLLYLNEPEGGGQTEFPRWVNGETSASLKAVPEKYKAVLFYSFLPDGNLDDLSQHAAMPVTAGEKYLINLWVRDPIFDNRSDF